MIDFTEAIERESSTFHRALERTDNLLRVPSCPGWTVADLAWHLTEVQHFWASIVSGLLDDPSRVSALARPPDDQLSPVMATTSAALVEALRSRDPQQACWSWYPAGRNVGWVMRRQAHEALIHRVDIELATGSVSHMERGLSVDGIDEILRSMIDASDLPPWARFVADERTGVVAVQDGGPEWTFGFGRFVGTSPESRTVYDEPAILLGEIAGPTSVRITGDAGDLDRWLWGRGPVDVLSVAGEQRLTQVLREAAAASTQ